MTKRFLQLLATLVLMTAAVVHAETLTNDSIIQLHKLGLGDAIVVEKIKASTCHFDTSVAGLTALKDAGLSDTVIQAMLQAPASAAPATPAVVATTPVVTSSVPAAVVAAVPGDPNNPATAHPSGIYLYQVVGGKPQMTLLAPSHVEGLKTGGPFDGILNGGVKTRAVLKGPHAELQIADTKPVFYFYFDIAQTALGATGAVASSPTDYSIGIMEAHLNHEKPERRIEIGNNSVNGSRLGLSSKDVKAFTTETIASGIFKVTPTDLSPGEYAFIHLTGLNMSSLKMFDFGITSASPSK